MAARLQASRRLQHGARGNSRRDDRPRRRLFGRHRMQPLVNLLAELVPCAIVESHWCRWEDVGGVGSWVMGQGLCSDPHACRHASDAVGDLASAGVPWTAPTIQAKLGAHHR